MAEVSHNTEYLNKGLDSIKTANDGGLNALDISSSSYSSTTNIPSREPKLLEQLLKASKDLYNKLNTDITDIRAVGDGFISMDNFLSDQNTDLGFQVQSNKVDVVDLSEFAATSLEQLLEKDVPIIKGYNDDVGKNNDPGNRGNNDGGSQSGSEGGSPVVVPTTQPSETPTTVPTEAPSEVKTETTTEISTEITTEITTEIETEPETIPVEPQEEPTSESYLEPDTEIITEIVTEAPVVTPTEAPVEQKSENKPSGGGVSKKPKNTNVETKPETVTEPYIDPLTEPITEAPYVEPVIETYTEPVMQEVVVEEPVIVDDTATPTPNNKGKVAAGVIAGLGLAGGAAAVGYGMYKKKQEDKEYEEYGYEDGGEA